MVIISEFKNKMDGLSKISEKIKIILTTSEAKTI